MAEVTSTGIEPSSYDDYLDEWVRSAETVFGMGFASDPRGIAGQLFGLAARRQEAGDIGLVEAMNARDIRTAGGVHLQILLSLAQILPENDANGDYEGDVSYRNRGLRMLGWSGNGASENIESKVSGVTGVTKSRVESNDTSNAATVIGVNIAANSIHAVVFVDGNEDDADIAKALWDGKSPGIGTVGSESQAYTPMGGTAHTMRWTEATEIECASSVTGTVNADFPSNGQELARESILDYFVALRIGETPTVANLQSAVYRVLPVGSLSLSATTLTRQNGNALGTITLNHICTLADADLTLAIS